MSATLTFRCDFCGEGITRDVTSSAASGCRIYAGYPDDWRIGDTHDACAKTACQAACVVEDNPPQDEPCDDERPEVCE